MKKRLFIPVLIIAVMIGGCGSEFATGAAGLGAGFAASETMKGIEQDLANREQVLIDRYVAAVESGARQETLDKLEQDIGDSKLLREGVSTGKKLFSIDWNDPQEGSLAIGQLITLGYLLLTKKKLIRTQGGVNKFMANTDKVTANDLFDTINKV